MELTRKSKVVQSNDYEENHQIIKLVTKDNVYQNEKYEDGVVLEIVDGVIKTDLSKLKDLNQDRSYAVVITKSTTYTNVEVTSNVNIDLGPVKITV